MPGDVINLRHARKARTRAERGRAAEENRRLHGRTLAERKRQADEQERARSHVERHRIEHDDN
jgi:hypothetical protein